MSSELEKGIAIVKGAFDAYDEPQGVEKVARRLSVNKVARGKVAGRSMIVVSATEALACGSSRNPEELAGEASLTCGEIRAQLFREVRAGVDMAWLWFEGHPTQDRDINGDVGKTPPAFQ